jgi:hypothetical protein
MKANLTLILYFLLLLLVIVSASVLVTLFLNMREGFANALEDYKSTSGYKTAAAAVVSLADSRGNGRRDLLDMLASSVAPPPVEQCLVNFYSLGCRFSGSLGPFSNGYFDTDVAVTSALKMGCRTFVLEIDYLDSCPDFFPRLVVRDVNGRIRSNDSSSIPNCNTLDQSNIKAVCNTLRVAAFGPAVQNPNDPLIVVLYLLRLPPRDKVGTGNTTLLTYLSNVAKCLAPLLDKTVDNIGNGGTFARQQQESTLLTNNIVDYQGRVLFFSNADTSPFRTTTTQYSQNEDLDYIVNLRLTYKQSQLGCTSNKTGGTPYSLLETAEMYDEAHGQAAFGLAIGAEPGWQGGALFGGGAGLAQGRGQQVERGAGGIAEMVEQHHHREPLGRHVEAVAAPAAQRAAMAGDGLAEFLASAKAEAIGGGGAIGEMHRGREAAIEAIGVIARGVDKALPGDHIVERGGEAGIAGPEDAVLGGAKAAGDMARIALSAIGQRAGIGGEDGAGHAGGQQHTLAKQGGEILARAGSQDVGEDAEILVHIGIAAAGGEMQAGGAAQYPRGFGIAEGGLHRAAMQHGDGPVIAQA